ncbi:probable glycosyltransferase At3g07620 [Carica papaya]|uniref:probable glycosyltransferase At3g07620 n=1 Tax=Carica papaya TaxID=3649 RepID=UPI000B8C7708|nr:probable glycosyltransferase At3g07620 [Carica papaya]
MRTPQKKSYLSSSIFSSSFWLLYLLLPLSLLIFLLFKLPPDFSSWSSLSSSLTGRFDFSPSNLSFTSSSSSSSSSLVLQLASNNVNASITINGSSSDANSFTLPANPAPAIYVISNNASTNTSDTCTPEILKEEKIPQNGEINVVKETTRVGRLEKLESRLSRVRSSIREAALVRNLTSLHADPDYVPWGSIYRNPNSFHRSYLEMEKMFKIYVYEEGEPPMFHNGPCKSIYSTEGRFINEMEKGKFHRTKNPDEALVYFLPFSVVMMVQYLYVPESTNTHSIGRAVVDYITLIANRYPFWNRSLGADHFMLSCHDWGPRASSYVPNLFNNSIRVLCNANTSEGFNPAKDASFPEINLITGEINGLLGGESPSRRPILAFFAGRLHGHIRHLLLQQWKDKDDDVQVYDHLPEGESYTSKLKKSKFCLCPSGYEVASPRVVEAIYAECVPVLISESYTAPFSDVLNWKAFSVEVKVEDIPNIKKILGSISQRQYLKMQRRVKEVQRHFVVNSTPKRFDFFHMTLHSVWLRRLNVRIQDKN